MNFKKQVEEHLSHYRFEGLDITEEGEYRGRKYGHILPIESRELNILEPYRERFFSDMNSNLHKLKFHQYFHHLNSSQGVCFNYFYPFVAENCLDVVAELFHIGNDSVIDWAFEKVVNPLEQTNFDFYMKCSSGKQVFFEIKYTENEFGSARSDASHQQKYQDVYGSLLKGKVQDCPMEDFFAHYQILRNVSYLELDTQDVLIFIYPQGNTSLGQSLEKVLNRYVVEGLKDRIFTFTWETVIQGTIMRLIKHGSRPQLLHAMELFKKKYLCG